jgi:nitric oxide dioxygenase
MYAKNIEKLENLGPLVGTIINKHVSLQIQPEHYPIVGASLLKAIREVLGAEVATDAVIEAWGAAYGQLADILIGAEESIYKQNEQAEGGWRGARDFKVASKTVESDEITSFVLAPADGGKVVAHKPGQYIGLTVKVAGQEQRRQYSLSAASNGADYRISVKRENGGLVSNYLHDRCKWAIRCRCSRRRAISCWPKATSRWC